MQTKCTAIFGGEVLIKDVLRTGYLLLCGLFIAVIVYPFLDELGYSLAAVLFGAKVIEFHLLAIPNILCNSAGLSIFLLLMIGFSGMMLPFSISMLIRPKNYYMWYGGFVLKGISLLSFIISIVAVILYLCGSPVINEDVTQIINFNALSLWQILIAVMVTAAIKPLCPCFLHRLIKKASDVKTSNAYFCAEPAVQNMQIYCLYVELYNK